MCMGKNERERASPALPHKAIVVCAGWCDVGLRRSNISQAIYCTTLQHLALTLSSRKSTLCNPLQHTAPHWAGVKLYCDSAISHRPRDVILPQTNASLHHTAPHFTTLHHTAAHCTTLHHTAPHCTTLQHTAPHCTTPHHTAPHCTTLQHTATHCNTRAQTIIHPKI